MRQAAAGADGAPPAVPSGGRGFDRARWRRRSLGGALAASVVVALLTLGPLEPLELAGQDLRLNACPVPAKAPPIVLVGITAETYGHYSEYPELFWGHLRAEAVNRAVGRGARVVALDMIQVRSADAFLDRLEPRQAESLFGSRGRPDRALLTAVRRARERSRSVVVGWSLRANLRALPGLVEEGADPGFVDRGPEAEEEPGGVVRHAQLWDESRGGPHAGFAAAVALRMRGESPSDRAALTRLERPFAGGSWPHSLRIHYAGPSARRGASRFPACSLEELLEGTLSQETEEAFRGAAVLIGPLQDLADVHRAPGGEADGLEIHAQALATLLEDRPLCRLPLWAEALLALGVGIGFTLVKQRSRVGVLPGALAAGGILVAGHCAAQFAATRGWMVPEVGPGLALAGVSLAHYGVRLLEEIAARGWAETVLGRQVDARLARALLDQEAANELGGVQREVTVLFTDLRGFTALADRTEDPSRLFAALAAYLERMAECVGEQEGTLDKFIGDAVMAFWNAPFPQEDHALRALRCARRMQEEMDRFNAEAAAQGWPPLRMGVGINTGSAVVGQVGSRRRMNYTVIGSPVNLAARLESATRDLPAAGVCEVLLGDATRRALREHLPPEHGTRVELELKGFQEKQVCWRLHRPA